MGYFFGSCDCDGCHDDREVASSVQVTFFPSHLKVVTNVMPEYSRISPQNEDMLLDDLNETEDPDVDRIHCCCVTLRLHLQFPICLRGVLCREGMQLRFARGNGCLTSRVSLSLEQLPSLLHSPDLDTCESYKPVIW